MEGKLILWSTLLVVQSANANSETIITLMQSYNTEAENLLAFVKFV